MPRCYRIAYVTASDSAPYLRDALLLVSDFAPQRLGRVRLPRLLGRVEIGRERFRSMLHRLPDDPSQPCHKRHRHAQLAGRLIGRRTVLGRVIHVSDARGFPRVRV